MRCKNCKKIFWGGLAEDCSELIIQHATYLRPYLKRGYKVEQLHADAKNVKESDWCSC